MVPRPRRSGAGARREPVRRGHPSPRRARRVLRTSQSYRRRHRGTARLRGRAPRARAGPVGSGVAHRAESARRAPRDRAPPATRDARRPRRVAQVHLLPGRAPHAAPADAAGPLGRDVARRWWHLAPDRSDRQSARRGAARVRRARHPRALADRRCAARAAPCRGIRRRRDLRRDRDGDLGGRVLAHRGGARRPRRVASTRARN